MAIRPDYTIGTLTLTSGSANFTTTGSALQTAAVQAGDAIITRSGDVLIIATITGQNSGTLFQNCPASAAGAGQPLRIRFQPDGSRYQGAARDLIEKLASGNVDALAGLTGAADRGVMFNGVGTMTLFALTAFARSMLDDANASDVLTTLGFSAFAKTIIDDTSGAAMWTTMGGVTLDGANSGYVRLPDTRGTIIQRGAHWTGNGTTVTFPMAFPNAVRMVLASIRNRPNAGTPISVMTGFEGLNAFAAYTFNTTTGAAVNAEIYWEAWGH